MPTKAKKKSGRAFTMWTPRIEAHEWPTRMILSLRRCLRSTSESSTPSCVMRATVMAPARHPGFAECSAGAALIPLDHCEVLQPQPESGVAPRVGRVARSAVKKEQHRVALSSPRIVIHCWMPPTSTYRASSMPFGVATA